MDTTAGRAERAPDHLCKSVWQGRIHASRLSRYYAALAAKRARQASTLMILGCFAAFAGPYFDTLGSWVAPVISLAGVVLAVLTMARGHERIIAAMFQQHQLDNLHVEWSVLWQQVEDRVAGPAEVADRYAQLSRRVYEITAQGSQHKEDHKLSKRAEDAAYNYYTHTEDANVPATT